MILNTKHLILAILYILFGVIVYHDSVEAYRWLGMLGESEPLHLQIFVNDSLFNVQQIMFVQTFFFLTYLYTTHKPITTPQFILRCRHHYFRKLVIMGLKRAGSYSMFAIMVNTMIPIMYGSPIEFNLWYFIGNLRFFLIIFVMFLIYLTLLLTIKQEIFSIVGIGVINVIISAATLATWSEFVQIVVLNMYLVLGVGLIGFIYFKCKKGEFV